MATYPKLTLTIEHRCRSRASRSTPTARSARPAPTTPASPATLQIKVWPSFTPPGSNEPSVSHDPSAIKFADGQLITVAFVPAGSSVPKPNSIAAMLTDRAGSATTTTTPAAIPTTTTASTPTTTSASAPTTTAPSSGHHHLDACRRRRAPRSRPSRRTQRRRPQPSEGRCPPGRPGDETPPAHLHHAQAAAPRGRGAHARAGPRPSAHPRRGRSGPVPRVPARRLLRRLSRPRGGGGAPRLRRGARAARHRRRHRLRGGPRRYRRDLHRGQRRRPHRRGHLGPRRLPPLPRRQRHHPPEGRRRPDRDSASSPPTPTAASSSSSRSPPPTRCPTNLINAGTYVLEPEVLARIPGGRRVSVERETFPALAAEGAVFAMASDAYWLDTGTPAAYLQANADLLDGTRAGPPAPGARQVSLGVWTLGAPVVRGDDRAVEPARRRSRRGPRRHGRRQRPRRRARGGVAARTWTLGAAARCPGRGRGPGDRDRSWATTASSPRVRAHRRDGGGRRRRDRPPGRTCADAAWPPEALVTEGEPACR